MGEREGTAGFWWGNLRERNPFEDLGIEGRIILKLILNHLGGRGLDLVMDEWRARVNAVMNIPIIKPTRCTNFSNPVPVNKKSANPV